MRLAFFAQYGYSNPVLKMFQGGSRGAVFFFGKRLPLSFPDARAQKREALPGKASLSPVPSGKAPYCTRSRRRRTGTTPKQAPAGYSSATTGQLPCPSRKAEKRPPQKPNGATAVRRSSAAASHGWRTGIPTHRHDCGTHSWPGARCHGRRRRVPAPCRRNRR